MNLKHFNKIRESYKTWKPRSCPYSYYDWSSIFTPIEDNVWGDIRLLGLPFYPQFPVGRYFIDFADPVNKIGIEVDGREWHQDIEKDLKRQKEIESMGWKIIRIQGRKTFKTYEDYFPEDFEEKLYDKYEEEEDRKIQREYYREEYITECSEGILIELRDNFYRKII